jgi:hypothetical protein
LGLDGLPLPLAGEVGAQRRVRAFSPRGFSLVEITPTPTHPRKREREYTADAVET